MKYIAALAVCAAFTVTSANAATPAAHFKGQQFASQSRITLADATTRALKARPGRIVDKELEKESGGSGLRYSFDIVSKGKTVEVGIDAVTGKVLENGVESAATEAAEHD